jgi:circadian clock protein KaiC
MRSPKRKSPEQNPLPAGIAICPTGIHGLDEIAFGGLPRGRPTLVCGDTGCGKTLLGMEFLVRGATPSGQPGGCLSFEETAAERIAKVASLGFDAASGDLSGKERVLVGLDIVPRASRPPENGHDA